MSDYVNPTRNKLLGVPREELVDTIMALLENRKQNAIAFERLENTYQEIKQEAQELREELARIRTEFEIKEAL